LKTIELEQTKKRKSFKRKMMVTIIPILALGMIVTSLYNFYTIRHKIIESYELTMKQTEGGIIYSIQLADSGYRIYERKIENELTTIMKELQQEYLRAHGDPAKMDLLSLNKKWNTNFYVLDQNTTVVFTNDSETMGFNLEAKIPGVGSKMDQIRESGKIHFERIRTSIVTGMLNKFAYQGTPDNKYVFDISYNASDIEKGMNELDPLLITNNLKKLNPLIKEIKLFDLHGYQFANTGSNTEPTKEIVANIQRTIKEGHFEIEGDGEVTRYVYVNLFKPQEFHITDPSKIVAITYDKKQIEEQLHTNVWVNALITISLIILISLVIIVFTMRNLVRPIEAVIYGMREVKDGNLTARLTMKSNDELGELRECFNEMVNQNQQMIETIQKHVNHSTSTAEQLSSSVA